MVVWICMGSDEKSASVLRYVVIPGLLFFIVITVINIFVYQREFTLFHNIYVNEIAVTKSVINRRFQSALIAAESIRALFVSSTDVTKEEFDSFGEILTKNIALGSIAMPLTVEWVDARNNIRYVYPMNEDNAKIVGLDLNTYPNRLIPITKAKTTRLSVVTEPIMLGQGYPGVLLYTPIYKGDKYLGEAVVVIRLSTLIAPVAGTTAIYDKDERIQTGNYIIPFDDDIILNNNGERVINSAGALVKDSISQKYSPSKESVQSEDIVFADKVWKLKIYQSYVADANRASAVIYAVTGVFFLVSITFLLILQKQRKRLLKEIVQTEALLVNIADGLIACDKNGVITFVNNKAEEIFGFSADESVGKPYIDVWRDFDSKGVAIPVHKRPFYRALTHKEVVNVTTGDHQFILTKDKKRMPLSSTIAPLLVNGQVEGAIVVFRDITKESEVDRMKTEFLSLVTHQLLTPSTSIKWCSEILLSGDLGTIEKKQLENIQNIYNANEDMIRLVNSLLNISRIESGRMIVDPKPTFVPDLVNEVMKELTNKITEKKHTFHSTFEKDVPKINIDPNLIRQVYKNLFTNAIKYTPAKGTISVTVSKVKNDIVSKISDTGYGIPEKEKGRVFEKFYRGENIVTREKDGNGLGLYLVKQIVEVSGGKIWFESKKNKGTTFWFSLPVSGSAPKKGEVSIT